MASDIDKREQLLRMELMQVQIYHERIDIEKIRKEMRWEVPKAIAAIAVGVAAMAGIILGVAHLLG